MRAATAVMAKRRQRGASIVLPGMYAKALLHLDSDIADSAGKHTPTLYGDAAISTAQSKFGSGSLYMDGSAAGLDMPDSDDWHIETRYFAQDQWVYFSSTPSELKILWELGTSVQLYYVQSTNLVQFFILGQCSYTWPFTPATATWYHLALVRDASGMRLYINGVLATPTVITTIAGKDIPNYTLSMLLGHQGATYSFHGHFSEWTWVIGTDRISDPSDPIYCGGNPANGFSPPTGIYVLSPVPTRAPEISGQVVSGELATCSTGTWSAGGSSYTYQWTSNGSPISGATSNTYTLTASEIGTLVDCSVTAINANGSTVQTSLNPATCQAALNPLAFGPHLYVDATDTGTLTLSGSDVTLWEDQTQYGRDLSPSASGKEPTYSATSLGGYPGVTFDGVTDSMRAVSWGLIPQPFTRIYVFRRPVIASAPHIQMNNASGTPLAADYAQTANTIFQNAGANANIHSIAATTNYVRVSEYNGTASMTYDNDSSDGPENVGLNGMAGIEVGSQTGAAGSYANITVSAIVIFNRVLNATDRAALMGWLATRYGITL